MAFDPWGEFGKWFIVLGILFIVIGIFMLFGTKLPLSKFPLGRLPGDIVYERPNVKIYFPWVSCLLISLILSLVFYLWRR